MRHELGDCEWGIVKPMLPHKPRGVPRVNDRPVLNGIFWVLRSGAPWRDRLEGMLDLIPSARVGHFGICRRTSPCARSSSSIPCWPPAAVTRLKQKGARDIHLACLLSAPEGIRHFNEDHPDVSVFTAAVDRHLNHHGYFVPGLGDAGDRMFGTK